MVTERELIGPCGMNCGLCTAYLAYSHQIPKERGILHCSGCRVRNKNCAFIKKSCPHKVGKDIAFCFECTEMPCPHLKTLDARYRRDYNTSLIKNLEFMKEHGVDAFIKAQQVEHRCPKCGDVLSVHNEFCYSCDREEILNYVAAKKTTVRKHKPVK